MPADLIAHLRSLSDDELHQLIAEAAFILQARAEGSGERADDDEPADVAPGGSSGDMPKLSGASGWIEVKMVNGCGPYAYARWWAGKKKRSQYLGKVKTQ